MTTDLTVTAYFIYIPIALVLTWFVARNLFKNGLVYMRDIFNGREEIAVSTNQLFKTGFYLLNVGFALWILKMYQLENTQEMIEALSQKIGGFSIYLGAVLFVNLFMFFRGKKAARQNREATERRARMIPNAE
ncbi:hypothetical protein Oweho_1452 [Owenweeksia hongkongensis DSM 17368]|uniref:Integral membrane protein n=1 Tax=Owenweeksia hongkongensis (strain DSM 17368 / CIP 108786 / JCM 12287 / NRRL B-23963 / UST20020801) TaxID=926562 RepID=G8R880_OWEHD|nr:hypothetical protein [Owenweeksia hongkongensis]AEV32448.1 hypothetical protein Oweho_1452 [Owenweeksia hongkongensis DSM 17368]